VAVWVRTLLDLFKSAPVQRMENAMSREAAFAILFVLLLAPAAIFVALGSRSLGVVVALGALIAAGIALSASGLLRKENAVNDRPAGKFGIREWWVVVAAVMGVVEIVTVIRKLGISQLIVDHKVGDVFGFVIVGGGGLLVIGGSWFRSRSRSTGDWMIVVGLLPYLALVWQIYLPVLAIGVMAMALIDSARGRRADQARTA
jgi:hypothetical protein